MSSVREKHPMIQIQVCPNWEILQKKRNRKTTTKKRRNLMTTIQTRKLTYLDQLPYLGGVKSTILMRDVALRDHLESSG